MGVVRQYLADAPCEIMNAFFNFKWFLIWFRFSEDIIENEQEDLGRYRSPSTVKDITGVPLQQNKRMLSCYTKDMIHKIR